MSEFKGTPGPWEYKASSSDAHKWISTSEGVLMSSDYPFSQSINASEHDWRLIAAAPDLLESQTMGIQLNTPDFLDWMAERLVNVYGESPHVDFVLSLKDRAAAGRAAIAKALGGQK